MFQVSSAIPKHLTRLRFLKSHLYRSFAVATKRNAKDKRYSKIDYSDGISQFLGHRLKSSSPIFECEEENSYHHTDSKKQKKVIPFLLADIGEGIAEVEVLKWFVSPGDTVKQFDRVCEVQSDKATVEITSRYDGVIESLSSTHDDIVKVGSPLMHIVVEDDNQVEDSGFDSTNDIPHITRPIYAKMEEDNSPIKPLSLSSSDNNSSSKILATPAVRKIISDNDIDVSSIYGSGPNGRVLKADVLKILKNIDKGEMESSEQEYLQGKDSTLHFLKTTQDKTVTIRGYNRVMVKTMEESLSIPHMSYADEVNMNEILKIRKTLGGEVKLSILPFVIKAASLSIQEFPILNSSIDVNEMTIKYHPSHDVGVAIDSPRGLIVPVVRGCQNLSILEIAEELIRLKETAVTGSIAEDDLIGATFSLSNIGAIGGTYMSPIIASPQVAIGAIGRIQRLPRFVASDSLKVKETNIMQVSWAADHRAIDGATLARFSNKWKSLVENPTTMLVSMK